MPTDQRDRAARQRIGRWLCNGLTALLALLLLFDAAIKIFVLPKSPDGAGELGWSASLAPTLGVILALCTALYVWPRTALLGSVLLTGYLGGAVATHLRVGNPLVTHTLFGVYLGIFIWGALLLRDPLLRAYVRKSFAANRSRA